MPVPSTPRTRSVRFAPAAALGGAFLLILAALGTRVRASGAVPVEEFGPAKALYGAIPAELALGIAGLVLGGILALRAAGNGRFVLPAGAAVLLGAAAAPILLVPGALILVAGAALLGSAPPGGRDAAADAAAAAAARPRVAGLARTFLAAAGLITLAAAALALAEASLRTAGFSPRLFPPETLAAARLGLLAWAGLAGLMLGAVTTAAVLALSLGLRAVRRFREDGRDVLSAATLAAGLGGAGVLLLLLRGAFGDEIDALGLAGGVTALFVLLAYAVHAHLRRCLVRSGARGPAGREIDSPGALAAALAVFALLPSRIGTGGGSAARRRATTTAALVAACGLLLVALSVGLYPSVEDYREKGFSFYGAAELLVTATLLLGLARLWLPRRARGVALAAAGLLPVAALLAGAGAASRPDVRLVLHEYTRFGPIAADWLRFDPLRPFPRIGESDPGTVFRFHADGEDVLPPRPAALADRPKRPPILLVVWDAVRPDHLSAFGDARETTPVLDDLARQSILFDRVYAAGTATTLSVRCFLSGHYATRYMLTKKHPPFLVKDLAAAGYDRFLVTVMGNDYNGVSAASFTRGWDPAAAGAEFTFLDIPNDDDGETDPPKVERVLSTLADWAAAGPEALDGTFTYLHLIGGHLPWESTRFGTAPADRYDGEIAKLDALLGRLLDGLKEIGVLDRMAVVLLADHGTGLGEHGRVGGFLTYEEQTRVPLLMRIPGLAPRRVGDLVSLVDLAPTLVGLVAPGTPNRFHGRSLMPLMTGEREHLRPRPVISMCAFNDAYAIVDADGRMKLWHHRGKGYEALYDLAADPHETRNLVRDRPAEALRLRSLLDAFLWPGRGTWATPWHYRPPNLKGQ